MATAVSAEKGIDAAYYQIVAGMGTPQTRELIAAKKLRGKTGKGEVDIDYTNGDSSEAFHVHIFRSEDTTGQPHNGRRLLFTKSKIVTTPTGISYDGKPRVLSGVAAVKHPEFQQVVQAITGAPFVISPEENSDVTGNKAEQPKNTPAAETLQEPLDSRLGSKKLNERPIAVFMNEVASKGRSSKTTVDGVVGRVGRHYGIPEYKDVKTDVGIVRTRGPQSVSLYGSDSATADTGWQGLRGVLRHARRADERQPHVYLPKGVALAGSTSPQDVFKAYEAAQKLADDFPKATKRDWYGGFTPIRPGLSVDGKRIRPYFYVSNQYASRDPQINKGKIVGTIDPAVTAENLIKAFGHYADAAYREGKYGRVRAHKVRRVKERV